MKLSVKNNYKNESTGIADTITDTMTGLFNSMTQSITGDNALTSSGTPGWWIDPYEPYQPQFRRWNGWDDLFPYIYPITVTSTGLTFSFIEFKDSKGVLEIDIPGVKKDKVELTLENGLVKLEYERKGVKYNKNYSFTQKIEADKTEAQLEDGVLIVTLFEKKPEVKKISIK